jgi:2-polyprenyl-3-methyl-5-hydroxy-6-metoxy-1,4-benzoquinol methylase
MKEVWEKQYDKNKPPWNYDKFDKDLSEFFRKRYFDSKKFSVIDLGCGNGSQAHYIENQFGNERNIFDVTATDIVNVLEYDVRNFIIDDALDSKLTNKYDIIIDRGLIHNLFHLKDKRHKYFEMIGNIIHDESYIVLKVMSPYEVRFNPATHSGPYRFNEKQLIEFFSGFNFKCIQLKDTFFYSNIEPPLRGYFSVYKKGNITA